VVGAYFSLGNCVGAFFSFAVAFVFCWLDLYQTISQSDLQVKNLFRSVSIVSFIAFNAGLSLGIFILTCAYPGDWIAKVIGQDIENPWLRGLAVGAIVTVIARSKLLNLGNNTGFGVDAAYSLLRTLALRRLNMISTLEVGHLAVDYQEKIRRCSGHDTNKFVGHLTIFAIDLLRSMYANDIPRRDRILEQFEQETAAILTFPPISELTAEGLIIKKAMNYCGMDIIRKDLDKWITRYPPDTR
jgi:hypothetical protein